MIIILANYWQIRGLSWPKLFANSSRINSFFCPLFANEFVCSTNEIICEIISRTSSFVQANEHIPMEHNVALYEFKFNVGARKNDMFICILGRDKRLHKYTHKRRVVLFFTPGSGTLVVEGCTRVELAREVLGIGLQNVIVNT